jgi:DNA replication protein DnaC
MTIQELCAQLKLSYIRDNAESAIAQARHTKQDYSEFLARLLTYEAERRTENGITRRINEAKFPVKKYLVDFDISKYDKAFAPKFQEFETLKFIDN